MSYKVNDKEFEVVVSLEAKARYNYFVKKVCDWQEIWSIGDKEGWALLGDNREHECVPVWPAKRYAEAFCTGQWKDQKPRAIHLSEWMNKWTPGMIADNRYVAVFPTTNGKGVVINPGQLMESLERELIKYGEILGVGHANG